MTVSRHTTPRSCRVLLGLAVLWGIIGLSGAGSWAIDTEHTRATLRGIEGVHVIVERLQPESERYGLNSQQLQTDVELQLRQAGIRVLTKEELFAIPSAPWLYINVNVQPRSEGLAAYSIGVVLNQRASLKSDGSLASVATWSSGEVGSVGSAHLSTIRDVVKDQVNQFVNAYLSVHPRPAFSPAPASLSPRRMGTPSR
jgi:hypothetical protein